jgi:hypothetical protein
VLASLLPGLRDLRTPLATGYLWLVALWLLLHDWIPDSVDHAQGPIKSLYQLGSFVGDAATLAALSFVGYLLGSMLRFQPPPNFDGGLIAIAIPRSVGGKASSRSVRLRFRILDVGRAVLSFRPISMYQQLKTFVSTRLRETASGLNFDDHMDVVVRSVRGKPIWEDEGGIYGPRPKTSQGEEEQILVPAYVQAVVEDLPAVGIQLQAKNRDFWDTYDRQLAEAHFRFGIVPPLILIIFLLAWDSGHWLWLFLLAAPVYLFVLGYRHMVEAASTLVQAVVLKMVEPPVLERLREVVAKKQEEEAKGRFVGGTRR